MDFQKIYHKLLRNHIELGYLRNKKIHKILKEVPLIEFFTPAQLKWFVLHDRPVLFFYKDEEINRTVSAPHMISMMTTMLELEESDKVLILGAKGGYIETIIAKLVKKVIVVEQQKEIADFTNKTIQRLEIRNVDVICQNPLIRVQEDLYFSKILITGAIPYIPRGIHKSLLPNGIIVVPLIINNINIQTILQILKRKNDFEIANFGNVIFSPLYVLDLPETDLNQDLTLEKLKAYSKLNNISILEDENPFFQDFNELPKIEILNFAFAGDLSISKKFNKNELDKKILRSNPSEEKISNIEYLNEIFEVTFYNPEPIPISIRFEIRYTNYHELDFSEFVDLKQSQDTKISFTLKIPTEIGNYDLELVGITEKNFRIAKSTYIMKIIHLDDFVNYIIEPY